MPGYRDLATPVPLITALGEEGGTSGKLIPSRHKANDGQQDTAERNRGGS